MRRQLDRRHPQSVAALGFTLIEVLVVVAIIGIVAAIAVPNFQRAIREARRTNAYRAVNQIERAIELHMAQEDDPPDWTMNTANLDLLVATNSLTEDQARSILTAFEGDQLDFYWSWNLGGNWSYHYSMGFRPKGEPNAWCWLQPGEGWCWYPNTSTWEAIYE